MSEQTRTIDYLAAAWNAAGVETGGTLLVHSSARRLIRQLYKNGMKPSLELFVESFLEALGPGGTLLLPLFNFDFANGIPFDIRTTPSRMGAITEIGRAWPGAVRTGHPIYSFVAIGHQAERFGGLENFSGYGADSPFGILHRSNGMIGVLDLPDNGSMTFYHYVEEACSVPYRYHKTFTGQYTDLEGITQDKTFGLFVRDLEKGVITSVDPMGERLWSKGLYRGDRPNEGFGFRTISAASLFDEVKSVIDDNAALGLLYDVQP